MAFLKVARTVFATVPVLHGVAAQRNLLGAGRAAESTVAEVLEAETTSTDSARLARFEDALRSTFTVLPKNGVGNLGHEAVRYALHRMFIQRHGWFIKGLEPGSDKPSSKDSMEWVPSYLQSTLESKLGDRGATLHDLAALAASLEDLINTEARERLRGIYEMLEMESVVSADQAREVIRAYYISFLLGGNLTAKNKWEAETRMSLFTLRYTGWDSAERWLDELVKSNFAAKPANALFSFDAIARMVEDVGENYYKFNDVECHELKGTLSELEGIKAGRVRLSFFYQKGLHSHWRFNEKPDYLRALGALDDSDADIPQVIVPNYVMARTNCLEASGLYAICCRNECEDLMSTLEANIGSVWAEPARIADIVAGMASDTVKAPRTLPSSLLARLDDVAASNGGRVPLHGRLFAQWMHHAFPRECPYPHEAGVNPQTPDEWMASQPAGAKEMTREDMQKTVEADQCASGLVLGRLPRPEDCGSGSGAELPWTPRESLLTSPVKNSRIEVSFGDTRKQVGGISSLDVAHVVCLSGLAAMLLYQRRMGQGSAKPKDYDDAKYSKANAEKINLRAVTIFGVLAIIAFLLGLLDVVFLGMAAVGAIGSVLIRHFVKACCACCGRHPEQSRNVQASSKGPSRPFKKDELYGKCEV